MLDKQLILKNVNQPEERLLLAKTLDQAIFSLKKEEKTFTSFYEPTKISSILQMMPKIQGLNFVVFGGTTDCERRMVGFCPNNREISETDFPIAVLEVIGDTRFTRELTHRDFLGSLLGLGIDRGKIGDIVVFQSHALIFVAADIAAYIQTNLERVGKSKVKIRIQDLTTVELPEKLTEQTKTTVSSLRLDALVGAAFSLSRGKAQQLITGEKVSVNWTVQTNGAKVLSEGDLISVRGFGRVKLDTIEGKTKKDRMKITFLNYI